MAEIEIKGSSGGGVARLSFRLTMVLGLLGTIAAGGWYAGGFSQSVDAMRGDISDNTTGRAIIQADVNVLREGASADAQVHRAVEQRLNAIDLTLRRIERKIDRAAAPSHTRGQ